MAKIKGNLHFLAGVLLITFLCSGYIKKCLIFIFSLILHLEITRRLTQVLNWKPVMTMAPEILMMTMKALMTVMTLGKSDNWRRDSLHPFLYFRPIKKRKTLI